MKPVPGKIIHIPTNKIYYLKNLDKFKVQSCKKIVYHDQAAYLFRRDDNSYWVQLADQIFSYFHQHFKRRARKLTPEQVVQIYQAGQQKSFSIQQLADMFNVSKTTINNILKRKTWKKLPK